MPQLAHQLAERLAAGERLQVLDVREDASWGIEAEGLGRLLRSADAVLDDPAALAREVDGEVAVVCGRGLTARPVAAALRRHGVEARVLEGGMRAWIAELQAHPVELGMDGVGLRQVQRPGRGCLSYVLAAEGRALVVDPAADADFYRRAAADLGADVTDVVETHLHADHLSGARKLARAAGASLRLPAESLARGIAYADEVAPLHGPARGRARRGARHRAARPHDRHDGPARCRPCPDRRRLAVRRRDRAARPPARRP